MSINHNLPVVYTGTGLLVCLICIDLWDVTGTAVERQLLYNEVFEVFFTRIKFTLHLQSKPLYYILTIVIPILFLIPVSLLVRSY